MAGKKISQLSSSLSPSLSGFTAVADGGVTYKSSLETLRNVLVDSGSHVFTGNQTIKGNLTVSGSLTAEEYILSSSITNIVLETISGSSHFGNDFNDVHNFTGSVNITGSLNVDNLGTITQLVVGQPPFEELGHEALHVGTIDDTSIAHFEGNNNIFTQINVRNRNSGSFASSDIVATADNGDDFIHYVDLGINSSTYNGGFVGLADDSYLLNVGKDMYIGTVGGVNFPAKLKLFAENSWENPQITISGSNQISFNTGSVSNGFQVEISGSVKFDHDVEIVSGLTATTAIIGIGNLEPSNHESLHVENSGSLNISHFQGNTDTFTQINLKNINSGSSASGDIVITADNGDDSIHFVDLGINSSTYNAGFVGRENDSYLINAGKDLFIGTIGGVNHPDTKLHLFAQNNWENSPLIISGSNQISFNTGSVSTGYVYEFSGSAKLQNDVTVDGELSIGGVTERIVLEVSGGTSTYEFDYLSGSIFYLTSSLDNNIYNTSNIPTEDLKAHSLTFLIKQESTPYIASSFKLNNDVVSVNWANNEMPTGSSNKTDVIGLTALRIGSSWNVLGTFTTFG
jgi:hypothetical protein